MSRYARPTLGDTGLDVESPLRQTSIDVIASALEPMMPAVSRLSSPDGAVTLMLSDIADADAMEAQAGTRSLGRLAPRPPRAGRAAPGPPRRSGDEVRARRLPCILQQRPWRPACRRGAPAHLRRRRLDGPERQDLALRIGLHSGFVIMSSDQPLGRNVVLAARIAALAGAGEILVSSTLKEYTESDPSFEFDPRGRASLQGAHRRAHRLPGPLAVLTLTSAPLSSAAVRETACWPAQRLSRLKPNRS